MSWSMAVVTLLCVCGVAYANGANDVSKGVATLVGAGLASYRRALRFGIVCTAAGSVTALMLSAALVRTFSTVLVTDGVVGLPIFPLAVSCGAVGWVLLATLTGLPVSTTHALAGAIVGVGIAAIGGEGVRWSLLGWTVGLPLALSPLVSGMLTYTVTRANTARLGRAHCVCVAQEEPLAASPAGGLLLKTAIVSPRVSIGTRRECETQQITSMVSLTTVVHWISAGTLSFARGLNDTPKIVGLGALALPVVGQSLPAFFVEVAVIMAFGGYWFGRGVTRTLAENTVPIGPIEGVIASSIAAVLVLLASFVALPVSTTHVVGGAIVGAGLRGDGDAVHWTTLRTILLAWIVTLPSAALIAAAAFAMTRYAF